MYHVWNIHLDLPEISAKNVGKYMHFLEHLGIKSTLQVQQGWRQSARPHRADLRCGLDVGGGSAFGALAEAQRMGKTTVKQQKT